MLPKVQHPRTHAFLCFQIIQATKIIRGFTPLLCSFSTLFIVLRHQLAKLPSFCLGTEPARPIGANNLNQNSLVTTHVVRRCCIDSSSWSQRGHLSGWESPLLASLSAVQHYCVSLTRENFCILSGPKASTTGFKVQRSLNHRNKQTWKKKTPEASNTPSQNSYAVKKWRLPT